MGRMRARRSAPWVAAVLTVAGVVFAIVLNALAGSHGEETWTGVAWATAALASSGTGLVLAIRRPMNPIGWLLLANGLVLVAHAVATPYADYTVLEDPGALPGADWAVLFHERAWPTLFICVTAIALVFPDGRLPSPRWRRIAIVAGTSLAALTVVSLLSAERYSEKFAHVSSPLPELSESVVGIPFMISGLGSLAGLVAAALAVRTRMKRASLVERLQLRSLAFAALLVPAAVVASLIESSITGSEGAVTVIASVVALTAVPVAIGVAVMRYRLYEIDRLINRTLVYVTAHRGARGDLRRDLADTGRGDRLGFHARDGRGHARGRAALQAASLAGPDSRGPALRSGPIRGPAQGRALPRGAAGRPRGTGGNGRGDGRSDRRPRP